MKPHARCLKPDCERNVRARGLCSLHYQKERYHGTLPPPPERTCPQCGREFSDRKWAAVYCSLVCNQKARYAVRVSSHERVISCVQCGTEIIAKRIDARFCSNKCGSAFHNASLRSERLAAKPSCVHCGGPVPLHARRFCSRECTLAHRRPEKYGLTRDEMAALLAQHDACAICGTTRWGKKGPQIDHDHATGAIRGVLCVNCNTLLGHSGDSPDRLRAALAYLER